MPGHVSPSIRDTTVPLHVCFVGSHPPRECGIATFTRDTRTAVMRASPLGEKSVIAVNDPGGRYTYPPEVVCQIDRDLPQSYDRAAEYINAGACDVVNVQHEYGLFGGEWGSTLLRFLDRVAAPIALTLHTVLPSPEASLRKVTDELLSRATFAVVLARTAMDVLERDYGVQRHRLRYVPHGVPDVQLMAQHRAKHALGFGGRTVISTCGLMSRGKGIEYALEAVAELVGQFPDLLYVVAGETHPGVRAYEGESYREELQAQVCRLGLQRHVRFENRYLPYRELVLHLLASDVYLVPYLNLDQIVSGTLAYALGCGRAVVSTPSTYAREVLAGGAGLLTDVRESGSIRDALGSILSDPERRRDMEVRAYALGHSMIWPRVAEGYLAVFNEAREVQPTRVTVPLQPGTRQIALGQESAA